jgi:hypothetical protein
VWHAPCVQQRCPSLTHDVELTLNDKLAGRTDGKVRVARMA